MKVHTSPAPGAIGDFVDVLLGGPGSDVCLRLDAPVDRTTLRAEVARRELSLGAAGLVPGGTVALRLPPSLAYIANLLAAWRIGAQVALLDHRLTPYEVERALQRTESQVVVEPDAPIGGALRAFYPVVDVPRARVGRPAATRHALVQLSSGSTGPSKVIARTAADLAAEVERYSRMDGVPRTGERVVLLASMVHVLGLVGGLLYGLHERVELVLPERVTAAGVVSAIGAGTEPTTVLGVPFHIELLAAVQTPPALPGFVRMTTGGELVRPEVVERFTDRYGAVLANMYGMTEVGVIATDLFGRHRPALAPAPGIEVRVCDGELQVARPTTPYIGLVDATRWSDGWLRTRDAAVVDPDTGLVRILGRLDSQVSIGGIKVDLTEVEQELTGLPGIVEAVVIHDGAIEAFVAVDDSVTVADLDRMAAERLAPFKRPRRWSLLTRLPRTSSGKLVRSVEALRAASR
jgi:acyl-coenzyme A synthetase/AMP-(fatty) acid ligase